jgi:hypothetical protein
MQGNLQRTENYLDGIYVAPRRTWPATRQHLDGSRDRDAHVYLGYTYDCRLRRFGRKGLTTATP